MTVLLYFLLFLILLQEKGYCFWVESLGCYILDYWPGYDHPWPLPPFHVLDKLPVPAPCVSLLLIFPWLGHVPGGGSSAARVRDLFQRGVASQPSIIFIDELDALAKVRGGINSNDEREQTLNQLLTEMDGFDSEVGVKTEETLFLFEGFNTHILFFSPHNRTVVYIYIS